MYFSLSEDPETIMETIREDSRFEDLAHEEATILSVGTLDTLEQQVPV